ncbi:component of IIS longevity pathway SMK-1-domain-containing protein [Fimicolochytrium jonesii]|uniref:component of IIS longevity pathway SMK-1-domain-containing protein n=1 Tax=Fimicolochytrium jonesii TaxID=1396493 RepID=UPI0022FE128D|nr:component of IIS longevity pathway SMK-1-domain-containing protein [Fimicolochytrium jonesii]KAI8816270.1 component of IIS longevity pathway SMK-1-domain-containing protein [Fimicolochytrium jonesii]
MSGTEATDPAAQEGEQEYGPEQPPQQPSPPSPEAIQPEKAKPEEPKSEAEKREANTPPPFADPKDGHSSPTKEHPPQSSVNGKEGDKPATLRFVKVFELDSEGKWSDQGMGHVECVFVEKKDCMCLVVRSDKEGSVLLNTTIRSEVNYVRQQDTLVVWTEPSGEDLALSFQDVGGCNDTWNELTQIRKRLAADKHDIDQLPENSAELLRAEIEESELTHLDLPDPTMGNVKELELAVCHAARFHSGRAELVKTMERTNFVPKLFPVFEQAEDLDDFETLHALANILRAILTVNEGSIYQYLLSDEVFKTTLGMLEYDGDLPNQKANHREHFEKNAKFKEVVPIKDEDIKAKIIQTYRVQYLKDAALLRYLDDGMFSALLSIIFFNNVEILQYVKTDATFLKSLFALLSEKDVSEEKKKDALNFLHELFSVLKQLQGMNRNLFERHCQPKELFKVMVEYGLFNALDEMLTRDDVSVRTTAAAIAAHVIEHDTQLVREQSELRAKTPGQKPFAERLVALFLSETNTGLRAQYAEMVRALLDTKALDTQEGIVSHSGVNAITEDKFLDVFYERWMPDLISPILQIKADVPGFVGTDPDHASRCNHICEMLLFIIKQHDMRGKFLLVSTEIVPKVALLLHAKDTYLRLSALRVFRTCLTMTTKDDFYTKKILLEKNVMGHIMRLFIEVKHKSNLLNSACLEIFDYLVKENPKPLVANVVTNFRDELAGVTYVRTCQALILRYEQNIAPPPPEDTPEDARPLTTHRRDGWTRIDEDEDAYFNGSDDDDLDFSSDLDDASTSSAKRKATSPPPSLKANGTPSSETPAKIRHTSPPTIIKKSAFNRGAIEFVPASPDLRLNRPLVDYPDDDDDDDDDPLVNLVARNRDNKSPLSNPTRPPEGPVKPVSPLVRPKTSTGPRISFSLGTTTKVEKRPRSEDGEEVGLNGEHAAKKGRAGDMGGETVGEEIATKAADNVSSSQSTMINGNHGNELTRAQSSTPGPSSVGETQRASAPPPTTPAVSAAPASPPTPQAAKPTNENNDSVPAAPAVITSQVEIVAPSASHDDDADGDGRESPPPCPDDPRERERSASVAMVGGDS